MAAKLKSKKKMKTSSCTFSLSEEAFLLNSIHEIIKIWARGSRKASFSLDVSDGQANLSLVVHPKRRHKKKDRTCAAAYQARLQPEEAAPARHFLAAAPAVVKQPFSGKLLPLNSKPPEATLESKTPPSTSSSMSPTTPKKLPSTSGAPLKKYLDVCGEETAVSPPAVATS